MRHPGNDGVPTRRNPKHRALHARQGQGVRVCTPNHSPPRRWTSAVRRPSNCPSGAAPSAGHGTGVGHRHGPAQGKGGAGTWIGIGAAVVVLARPVRIGQGSHEAPPLTEHHTAEPDPRRQGYQVDESQQDHRPAAVRGQRRKYRCGRQVGRRPLAKGHQTALENVHMASRPSPAFRLADRHGMAPREISKIDSNPECRLHPRWLNHRHRRSALR